MLDYGKSEWRTLESGLQKEWLATNGIGGYASSTLINLNSRKYHGPLIAAHNPRAGGYCTWPSWTSASGRAPAPSTWLPTKRSGFRETGSSTSSGSRWSPSNLFTYSFKDISLDKTVFTVYGENSTVILYRVYNGADPALLTLVPLVNGRGHHCVTRREELQFRQRAVPGGVSIAVAGGRTCRNCCSPAAPAHLYPAAAGTRDGLQGGKGAGRERPGGTTTYPGA